MKKGMENPGSINNSSRICFWAVGGAGISGARFPLLADSCAPPGYFWSLFWMWNSKQEVCIWGAGNAGTNVLKRDYNGEGVESEGLFLSVNISPFTPLSLPLPQIPRDFVGSSNSCCCSSFGWTAVVPHNFYGPRTCLEEGGCQNLASLNPWVIIRMPG